MNAKDAIKYLVVMNHDILEKFVSDFSDDDLLVRPVPGANHTAWQWGHLITSKVGLLSKVPGAQIPTLPEGFDAQHGKETASLDPATGFSTKAEYLALSQQMHAATLAALEGVSEEALDQPSGWDMAPTVGTVLLMIANHDMMHSGQFSVIRRKLGKPVLF